MAAALDDLIVAEIGTRMGVSICGSLLAQLGATVIRIEEAGAAAGRDVAGAGREAVIRGKLSLGWDGSRDDALVRDLMAGSDVILTSSDTASPAARLLAQTSGQAIRCDITAFGGDGPLAGERFSEYELQAFSGLADTTGFPDGPPTATPLPIVSYLGGTYAASAVLAALRARSRQKLVQDVDIALFDCAFVSLHTFLSGVLTDPAAHRSRIGNRHPTVAPWNIYRTADGWVLICAGNQAQWLRLCDVIGGKRLPAEYPTQALRIDNSPAIDRAIEAWTASRPTQRVVETLSRAQVVCGPAAPIEGHVIEPNLDHRQMIRTIAAEDGRTYAAPGSPLRMSRTPGRALDRIPRRDGDRPAIAALLRGRADVHGGAGPATPQPAIAGLRVIEIGQYTAAPLCARHLAHLGAEVIKIERPGGDESRAWPPHVDGRSASFRMNNADKKSVTLDLRLEADRDVLRALLATADVLVENLKPGALAKFGLGPDAVSRVNPRIVHCAISGFGADSIYPDRPAFDTVIQAMSGLMDSIGDRRSPPLKTGISTADTMGATMAMVAILGALRHRDRTGEGQYVDLSMQDVSCWLTELAWNGACPQSPHLVRCRDGYVLVDATRPDAGPHRLPDGMADLAVADCIVTMEKEGIRAVPVQSVREASRHSQTLARGLWSYWREGGSDWPVLESPLRLKKTPPAVRHLAPDPNQDAEAVLRDLHRAGQGRDIR